MADSPGIVRELGARFGIFVDPQSVKKADDAMNQITSKLKTFVGIAAAMKVADFIGDIVAEADHLNDMAERIGTSTEALQSLGYAAVMSGSSAEDMHQGMKFLTKSIGEAASGSKTAVKAFADLGVSFKKSDGSLKNSADLLPEIADALAQVEDPTKRAALSIGVFSRAGQGLAGFLGKGSEEMAKLRQEFEELGGVFSQDFVGASAEAVDHTDRFSVILKSIGQAMGKGILPVFNKLSAKLEQWWKEDGPRIRNALTQAFETIGTIIENVIQLAKPFWEGFTTVFWTLEQVANALDSWKPIFAVLIALAMAFWAPWLIIPTLIALIAEDVYQFATGGESVIGWLFMKAIEYGEKFFDSILNAIHGLGDSFWHLGEVIFDALSSAFTRVKKAFSNLMPDLSSIGVNLGMGSVNTVPLSDIGGSVSNRTIAPTNNLQIQVNAAPGMSEKALMGEAVTQGEDLLSTYNASLGYAQ